MGAAELGVLPRDLGIVQVDDTGLVASEPQDRLLQLKTRALVISADHKQRRHDCGSRGGTFLEPVRQTPAHWPGVPTFPVCRQDFFDSTN